MRKTCLVALTLIVAVALATPALAGDCSSKSATTTAHKAHKKCEGSTQDCLNHMAAKLRAQGWIGIEAEHGEDGSVTITDVISGSPAADAGIRIGDQLVAMNGVELIEANYPKIKAMKAEMSPGSSVKYTVVRDGRKKKMAMTLAEMPDTVLAKWIGKHMIDGHIEIAANY